MVRRSVWFLLVVAAVACASAPSAVVAQEKRPPAGAEKTGPAAPPADPVLDDAGRKALAERTKAALAFLKKEKNRETVRKQIQAMAKSGDIADRDALIEFSRGNSNQEFIGEAFAGLVRYVSRPTFDYLMGKDALTGSDYLVQIAAATALGDMKHPFAVPTLVQVLSAAGTKIEVQGACLMALGKCGAVDETARDAVMRWSAHKHDTIRANAIEALGHLKTNDAYERLLDRIANEKNTRCRGAAAKGLGILGKKEAADILRQTAKTDSAQTVREEAVAALGALGLKL